MNPKPAFLLFFLAAACSSCTSIAITDAVGNVTIERSFGVSTIGIPDNGGLVAAEIGFIGYLSSPLGHNFGFGKQSILTADDSCRVVVWVGEGIDFKVLESQLSALNSVCITEQ